jgi:hypothetical protein
LRSIRSVALSLSLCEIEDATENLKRSRTQADQYRQTPIAPEWILDLREIAKALIETDCSPEAANGSPTSSEMRA